MGRHWTPLKAPSPGARSCGSAPPCHRSWLWDELLLVKLEALPLLCDNRREIILGRRGGCDETRSRFATRARLSSCSRNGADGALNWGKSGDWAIMVDTSVQGCFMLASYTRGDYLRVGFDNENKNGYLMLANEAWHSVELGKEYHLSFEFDGESPWSGTSAGSRWRKRNCMPRA
jgi:hypothetical protein